MYISRLLAKKSAWPSNFKKIELENDTFECWKSFFEDREPTLTCVLGLHLSLLDRGLENLIKLLDKVEKGHTIDHKTGQYPFHYACI